MRRVMLGDEVRLIPVAVAGLDGVAGKRGRVAAAVGGIDELAREVDQVLEMVCAWGDVGDALGAVGEIVEWMECFAEM